MKLKKETIPAPKLHSIVRMNVDGSVSKHATKLFRVVKENGEASTISVEPAAFTCAFTQFKVGQKGISSTVRASYKYLDSTKTWRPDAPKSSQTWALALKMFEAQNRGVSLDEYLHAEANNAAWQ